MFVLIHCESLEPVRALRTYIPVIVFSTCSRMAHQKSAAYRMYLKISFQYKLVKTNCTVNSYTTASPLQRVTGWLHHLMVFSMRGRCYLASVRLKMSSPCVANEGERSFLEWSLTEVQQCTDTRYKFKLKVGLRNKADRLVIFNIFICFSLFSHFQFEIRLQSTQNSMTECERVG